MSCKIEDIKKDSINEVVRIFRNDVKNSGGIKSIVPHPKRDNAVRVTIPRDSKKVKKVSQLPHVLSSAVKRVEEWAKDKFGAKFAKGWIGKPELVDRASQTGDTYTVNFKFPLELERAYEIKKIMEEDLMEDLGDDFFKGDNALREQENKSLMLQKKSKVEKEADKKLNDKLTSILSKYGITVQHLKSLKETIGTDAAGAADIINKLILISQGKESITTLPEEASHFFIEMLGEDNPIVSRLMEIIHESQVYKENYEAYSTDPNYLNSDGTVNERKVRKEMVGKALADAFIHNNEQERSSNKVLRALKRLLDKAMSYFRKVNHTDYNENVNMLARELANDIIKEKTNMSVDKMEAGIFLQKDPSETIDPKEARKIELLENSIKTLKARIAKLSQSKSKSNESKAAEIRSTMDNVAKMLDRRQTELGIRMFTGQVMMDLEALEDFRQRYVKGEVGFEFNSKRYNDMNNFIEYYKKPINDIITAIKYEEVLKGEYGDLLELLDKINSSISELSNFRDTIFKKALANSLEEHDTQGGAVEEVLKDKNLDSNTMRFWFGSLKNASSSVLRMVYNTVKKAKNKTDRFTFELGKQLISMQEDLKAGGFKDFSIFYEKDAEGKKTGRLIQKYNKSEYNKALSETIENIKKDLGVERYEMISKSQLSKEDRAKYNAHWAKFKKEHTAPGTRGRVPSDKYLNPDYETVINNKKAKEFLDKLIEVKKEADKKLPKKYRNSDGIGMPMIRKSVLDRLKSREGKFLNNVKEVFKDEVSIMEDADEFGSRDTIVDHNGQELKLVPVYYTAKLDNMNNLSDDITSMYIAYAKMADNFKNMAELADDLEVIRQGISKLNYKGKSGTENPAYKALDSFLDTQLYGKSKNIEKVKIGDKEIAINKLLDAFNSYVRRNNLAFNPFSTIAGYLTGSIYSKVEDAGGQFTTLKTKAKAELEFDANIAKILSQIGSKTQTNKMHLFMELNEVSRDLTETFDNLNINRGSRIIANDLFFGSYGVADYRVKAKVALAVAYNIREINGEYITENQLRRIYPDMSKADLKKKWEEAKDKTLYDAYEVHEGKLRIKPEEAGKVSDNVLDITKNRIHHIGDTVDGKLSPIDKGHIHRSVLGRIIMTHRGWIPTGIDARFKKGGYSYSTDEYEEGYFRSTGKLFYNMFVASKRAEASMLNYKNLDTYEKANVKRFGTDLAFMLAVSVIAAALNNAADDDDDYMTQFNAYMANRVLLETKSFWSFTEGLELLNSPAAGVNQFQDLTSVMTLFDGDIISKGTYAGKSKREKLLIKRSFLRHFYESQFPGDKNMWLERKVKDTMPYKFFREEKKK